MHKCRGSDCMSSKINLTVSGKDSGYSPACTFYTLFTCVVDMVTTYSWSRTGLTSLHSVSKTTTERHQISRSVYSWEVMNSFPLSSSAWERLHHSRDSSRKKKLNSIFHISLPIQNHQIYLHTVEILSHCVETKYEDIICLLLQPSLPPLCPMQICHDH